MADTHRLSDEHLAARTISRIVSAVEGARNDDLFDIVLAALRSARREGAEAMRERCAKIARDQGCGDPSCRKCVGGDIEHRLLALDPELPETPKD